MVAALTVLLRHAACISTFVLLLTLTAASTPVSEPGASWLERLNFYRESAALPPVVEAEALSGAVSQHARYMVMHGTLSHSERLGRRWATPEGAAAAAVSNLAASTRAIEPESWAVDVWMQAPFHALGILDPALSQVGFGIHHHAQSRTIQTAAALDVIRGRLASAPSAKYPIVWPANGSTVPLFAHFGEEPSPLTSCPGYKAPVGLPLIVQIGAGGDVPRVTGSWIDESGQPVEHCAFDEGSYRNRNRAQQQLGRGILAAHDAIVLVPRHPLRPGATYRARIDVNGGAIEWSFRVSDPSQP